MGVSYRLGIDVGTNSIGWWALILGPEGRPIGTLDCGVRIFSDGRDPQSGASLAQARREARAARRRRDRFLLRKSDLMEALVGLGLMPADVAERKKLEALDPYRLRAEGLDGALPLHHFGRALFHLTQRRGFKSNRKTDKGKDEKAAKETADMKGAIRETSKLFSEKGYRTLGEYLWKERREDRSVRGAAGADFADRMLRVRARPTIGKGGRNEYEMYFSRDMYRREFDALWDEQAKHHEILRDRAAREAIEGIIFRQRPLRDVEPGPCTFVEGDKRAPLALPIAQDFRILQELANLEIADNRGQNPRRLNHAERDKLFVKLKRRDKLTFKGIRQELKLPSDSQFNLEDAKRDELKGDRVSAALAGEECFGPSWHEKPEAEQTAIVDFLLKEAEEAAVIAKATAEWGLSAEAAEYLSAVRLPDGYGRIGLTGLRAILPHLRDGVSPKDGGLMRYDDAVAASGLGHHSDSRTGEIMDQLPYYGRLLQRYMAPVQSPTAPADERTFGRIANPTVHIGLNQIKKLINDLIAVHGHPAEIVVELARDLKLNAEERERVKKEQAENKKKNDARREKLREQGQEDRGDGLLRMRLWEELNADNVADRKCVYTGKQIGIEQLLSDEVEIEHILPFKLSLDDSPANLTVSCRWANRLKGNRTPCEAFKDSPPAGTTWDDILLRMAELPKNKQWRFRPDAMELVRDRAKRALEKARGALSKEELDEIERAGGFLARQLVDTAYLARVARQYLWHVCDPNKVRIVPGKLTALLRRHWGLNRLLLGNKPDPEEQGEVATKSRDDHRHHAIDAFVVACTDLSMLQRVSAAADQERTRLIDDMPPPWDGFHRDDLKKYLDPMVVSLKPDHGTPKPPHVTSGRLHEETAYGIIYAANRQDSDGDATLVYRKPLTSLNANEIDRIRDPKLRRDIRAFASTLLFDDDALEIAKGALKAARKTKARSAIAKAEAEIERLKAAKKSQKKSAGKDLRARLQEFADKHNVRRVRLLKTEANPVEITGANGTRYKAYSPGDNHRVEIFRKFDGTLGAEIVTVFDANRRSFVPAWRADNGNKHLMTVRKNDYVKLQANGKERVMRVVSVWERYLQLAEHFETNLAERYRGGDFKWTFANYDKLHEMRARPVTVDVLGRVRDPGPPN